MARYVLNPLLPYDQSLIGLINNDNAAVLVPPLKLSDVIFKNERVVPASANIPRQFVITMVNAANLNESIDLYYNKVHLSDMVTIPDDLIVGWYDPEKWDDARDLPKLKNALVIAMTNAGINPNAAISACMPVVRISASGLIPVLQDGQGVCGQIRVVHALPA